MRVWSLPKVFHTCGKNCGKSHEIASSLTVRLLIGRSRDRHESLGPDPRAHRNQGEPAQLLHLVQADDVSSPRTRRPSRVRVPNALFKDWLTKHYSGVIGEAMAEVQAAEPRRQFRRRDADRRAADRRSAPTKPRSLETDAAGRRRHRAGGPQSRATPSTPSSSARRISSRTPRAARSPRRRRAPTTRCSSTAAWGSARRT